MHNHNFQRGRLHMYSQNGLEKKPKKQPKSKPNSDCLLSRSSSMKHVSCKIFVFSNLLK